MPVHIGQHEGDVAGQKVVHFVSQGGLTQKLGSSDQVTDGHMEVGVARGPVGDAREGMGHQNVLEKKRDDSDIFYFGKLRPRENFSYEPLTVDESG